MKRVAVIGLGLMGGSLGLAIRKRRLPWHVAGYTRTPERGRRALKRHAIDSLHAQPAEAVAGADLVVLCAPILAIPQLAKACRAGLKAGAVVTDVGSTKAFLVAEVPKALRTADACFIGSHPMAGSEQQGIEAARADLYEGAVVVVTPPKDANARATKTVVDFWRRLGGRACVMDGREHDRIVARTSHLPHLAASLLAVTTARAGDAAKLSAFCGSGFADTSRVAEGSPDVWKDIVRTNWVNVAEELRAYKGQAERLIEMLDEGDFDGIQRVLALGRSARRSLVGGAKGKA